MILIQQAYFTSNIALVKAYHESYQSISQDNEPNNIGLMVIIYGNTRYLGANVNKAGYTAIQSRTIGQEK